MKDMWWVDRHGRLHGRKIVMQKPVQLIINPERPQEMSMIIRDEPDKRLLNRLVLDGAPKNCLRRLMQNLGLVLLVFSFVCFVIACFSADCATLEQTDCGRAGFPGRG